eukprot:163731_1
MQSIYSIMLSLFIMIATICTHTGSTARRLLEQKNIHIPDGQPLDVFMLQLVDMGSEMYLLPVPLESIDRQPKCIGWDRKLNSRWFLELTGDNYNNLSQDHFQFHAEAVRGKPYAYVIKNTRGWIVRENVRERIPGTKIMQAVEDRRLVITDKKGNFQWLFIRFKSGDRFVHMDSYEYVTNRLRGVDSSTNRFISYLQQELKAFSNRDPIG